MTTESTEQLEQQDGDAAAAPAAAEQLQEETVPAHQTRHVEHEPRIGGSFVNGVREEKEVSNAG